MALRPLLDRTARLAATQDPHATSSMLSSLASLTLTHTDAFQSLTRSMTERSLALWSPGALYRAAYAMPSDSPLLAPLWGRIRAAVLPLLPVSAAPHLRAIVTLLESSSSLPEARALMLAAAHGPMTTSPLCEIALLLRCVSHGRRDVPFDLVVAISSRVRDVITDSGATTPEECCSILQFHSQWVPLPLDVLISLVQRAGSSLSGPDLCRVLYCLTQTPLRHTEFARNLYCFLVPLCHERVGWAASLPGVLRMTSALARGIHNAAGDDQALTACARVVHHGLDSLLPPHNMSALHAITMLCACAHIAKGGSPIDHAKVRNTLFPFIVGGGQQSSVEQSSRAVSAMTTFAESRATIVAYVDADPWLRGTQEFGPAARVLTALSVVGHDTTGHEYDGLWGVVYAAVGADHSIAVLSAAAECLPQVTTPGSLPHTVGRLLYSALEGMSLDLSDPRVLHSLVVAVTARGGARHASTLWPLLRQSFERLSLHDMVSVLSAGPWDPGMVSSLGDSLERQSALPSIRPPPARLLSVLLKVDPPGDGARRYVHRALMAAVAMPTNDIEAAFRLVLRWGVGNSPFAKDISVTLCGHTYRALQGGRPIDALQFQRILGLAQDADVVIPRHLRNEAALVGCIVR